MAAKKTLETFNICANLRLQVTIDIQAKDFYEAIEKAKELKETDFVEILGCYDDGKIVGISYISGGEYGEGFKLK